MSERQFRAWCVIAITCAALSWCRRCLARGNDTGQLPVDVAVEGPVGAAQGGDVLVPTALLSGRKSES